MSLSDRFRNDTFDVEMRPIDEASNYSNRSSEERRDREVFKELSRLCVTKEAKDSLQVSDFHEGSPPNNQDPHN